MTIREVIQKSGEFLEKRGVESARLHSELLLGHVLKLPRLQLYLQFDRALTEAELGPLRELVKRRAAREPLQHILGSACFAGLDLKVNRSVLVPRPETELLAKQAIEFLRARFSPKPATGTAASLPPGTSGGRDAAVPVALVPGMEPMVLELGTGSGCLAIFLAVKLPAARVVTVDISPEALALARENAAAQGAAERIEFLQGDLFAPLTAGVKFDLIVSNPPYIPSAELANLQPEVREFDPHTALDGGTDGLDFYRRIAAEAPRFLRPGGRLMVEFGDGQAAALNILFAEHKWVVEAVVDDYSRRPRMLIARPTL